MEAAGAGGANGTTDAGLGFGVTRQAASNRSRQGDGKSVRASGRFSLTASPRVSRIGDAHLAGSAGREPVVSPSRTRLIPASQQAGTRVLLEDFCVADVAAQRLD